MATERVTITLPAGFDVNRHTQALVKLVAEKHGDGFEIDHIDPVGMTATASRQATITEVTARPKTIGGSKSERADSFEVRLPKGTKPSDGDRISAKMADQYEGFYVTTFEPFLGKAVLTRLDDSTARCRGAVSVALGVKPWDVQVSPRRGGGFDLVLPRTYVPSKHDDKLAEVATQIVGVEGWYVDTNPAKLTATIHPGEPPTFAPVLPYPFEKLKNADPTKLLIGRALSDRADRDGYDAYIDFEQAAHTQVSGTSGSGKASLLTTPIPVPASAKFPDGWATVGELAVGDMVFAADGTSVPVLELSPIATRRVYEIEFDDGQMTVADGEHLWSVSTWTTRANSSDVDVAARTQRATRAHARAIQLRALAHAHSSEGEVASIRVMAKMTGCDVATLERIANEANLPWERRAFTLVETDHTFESTHPVMHFRAGDLVDVPFKKRGAGAQLLLAARTLPADAMVSVRDLIPDASAGSRGSVRTVISRHAVGEIIPRTVSTDRPIGIRYERVYPADEFLMRVADHIEGVRGLADPLRRLLRTVDMIGSVKVQGGRLNNFGIDLASAIDLPEAELPLDPYVLGAWLGDGSKHDGTIAQGTSAVCTDADGITDQEHMIRHLAEFNARPYPSRPDEVISTYGLKVRLRAVGVLMNKHIPATYLRASMAQRLALLQGLMDTDGCVRATGHCVFVSCSKDLSNQVLELIRSLGIKATLSSGDAVLCLRDDETDEVFRKVTGIAYAIHFTTALPVFRLPRKLERLPKQMKRSSASRIFITAIRPVEDAPVRCIRIDHPEHLYLTDGFIPTHNTVTLNAMVTYALASGHELAIIDLPHKAVDFVDFKKFVRPGGWGCAEPTTTVAGWLPEALTTLGLVYDEGMRRAGLLAEFGVTKVGDLPPHARVRPIFVICDEVTGLLQLDDVPKGIPKDHPMVVEANQANLMRQMILGYMKKIAAELRFAGIRMVLSSQVSSVNTGVPTALRLNLGNKALLGPNPTEGNRKLSLADPTSVPTVPENVKADGKASKGVGVAELEGQPNVIFKSFYAAPADFVAALDRMHIPTTDRPRPTAKEIDKYTPSLEDNDPPPQRSGTAENDYGYGQQTDGEFLRDFDRKAEGGFAGANEARRQLDAAAGTTGKRKKDPFDMPAASEVVVTRKPAQNNPFAPSESSKPCAACGKVPDAFTGACACTN